VEPHCAHLARTPRRGAHDVAGRTLRAPTEIADKVASDDAPPIARTPSPNVAIGSAAQTLVGGEFIRTARRRSESEIELAAEGMTRVAGLVTLLLALKKRVCELKRLLLEGATHPIETDDLEASGIEPAQVGARRHRSRGLCSNRLRSREQDPIAGKAWISRLVLLLNGRPIQCARINPQRPGGGTASELEGGATGAIDRGRDRGVVLDTRKKRDGCVVGVAVCAHRTRSAICLRSRRVRAGRRPGRRSARVGQLGMDEAATLSIGTRSRYPEGLEEEVSMSGKVRLYCDGPCKSPSCTGRRGSRVRRWHER